MDVQSNQVIDAPIEKDKNSTVRNLSLEFSCMGCFCILVLNLFCILFFSQLVGRKMSPWIV